MSIRTQDDRLKRVSDCELEFPNRWGIPTRIFANEEIPLERVAVDELESVLQIQETVDLLCQKSPQFFGAGDNPAVTEVVLTPDFHKGAGIPIGTVLATRDFAVPQAIGNDVNCGMRLIATSLNADEVKSNARELESALRYVFFEGGRDIPMTPRQREALVQHGLPGLLSTAHEAQGKGIWGSFDLRAEEKNLCNMRGGGGYATESVFALKDYISAATGLSYDGTIGNLGGGNHFAEIQYVRRVLHGQAAHTWGLREGQVVVMIHAGSLGLGHVTGTYVTDMMKRIYPEGVARPTNDIFLLPRNERFGVEFDQFMTSMRNAANFAFGNRFFLAQMIRKGLRKTIGETEWKVVYDAPHNLMWEEQLDGKRIYVHRKGATPAGGWEEMQDTHFAHWGEPVIVPGSMGAPSYLLLGRGARSAMCSACHGAGRALSRGEAMREDDSRFADFMKQFTVITALDPNRPDVRLRPDILDKWKQELKKEAPYAYKDITPVIKTLEAAKIATPVVELFPLMTVKQ
jgi:tRNA-splicing ligase RtcB (3'-phosphate/5'-hydroxy nucleic acid ligase)